MDNVKEAVIGIHCVSTEEMVADALTKKLSADKFNQFVKMMDMN